MPQESAVQPERSFGRSVAEMRPVTLTPNVMKNADGSCLAEFGDTRVLCAATIEEGVPKWRGASRDGWVTAEYAMLPAATNRRTPREYKGRKGRSMEIERLVGRSLRAVCDLRHLGEFTVTVDCDVIQADGGTRTASITGAWVALYEALSAACSKGRIKRVPLTGQVAAISMGVVRGVELLDLDYPEDSHADVDMNLVGSSDGRIVEVQGTGERATFDREQLGRLLDLGQKGIDKLLQIQREVTGTGNPHKVTEIEAILSKSLPDVRFVALGELGDFPDPVEDGANFFENALIKARAAVAETGLPMAIADDSGLCVDALDGAPGIFSARWAGEHGNDDANNDKLERLMADVPDESRGARFHSTVVLVRGDEVLRGDGDCKGVIGHKRRGDHGFGYDPLFLPTDTPGKTMAELTPAEKNAISHRFHALEDLARKL